MTALTTRAPGGAVAALPGSAPRRALLTVLALLVAAAALLLPMQLASAHVVPYTTVRLSVTEEQVTAEVSVPLDDVEAATGTDLGDQQQADVDAQAETITDYLASTIAPTTTDGEAWDVSIGDLTASTTGDAATTGYYQQLTTTLTLTPPDGATTSQFDLGWTAIVDSVATHQVLVVLTADATDPDFSGARQLGVVARDTVTGEVQGLTVDLQDGTTAQESGFTAMVALGISHIAEGTDHQLFLLTLLLPAPLLAAASRWSGTITPRRTVRRILSITLAFTVGHSLTLALGALGLPVPQAPIEALIAVSILVAAVHAIRPLFPRREALIAGAFGLIHGLAFSETLRDLDLTGGRLVAALLGFNIGIEIMQLIVVAVVLPPLVVLARAGTYRRLRLVAAVLTGIAAIGWLLARMGIANPVADLADRLGTVSIPVVVVLWAAALVIGLRARSARRRVPSSASTTARRTAPSATRRRVPVTPGPRSEEPS